MIGNCNASLLCMKLQGIERRKVLRMVGEAATQEELQLLTAIEIQNVVQKVAPSRPHQNVMLVAIVASQAPVRV
jgi:hypothetical protein